MILNLKSTRNEALLGIDSVKYPFARLYLCLVNFELVQILILMKI